MWDNNKEIIKEETADVLTEIGIEVAFEVLGELVVGVLEGFGSF